MEWDLKYGELAEDEEYSSTCEDLKENLIKVQSVLDKLLPLKSVYWKMTVPDRIEYDLFMVYTLNSLYFIQLRLEGVDTNNHQIKHELQRIKERMMKWQEIKSRNLRPKLDIEAAKRFVRSGLYDHTAAETPNKKIKFADDE